MSLGADGVELDVRLSRDGVVVVVHDPDLSRLTNGRDLRSVAALTAQELAELDLGQGARIPSLREVLIWASKTGALLNIELKSDLCSRRALARKVLRLCDEVYPAHGPRLVLSSFHLGLLLYLKAHGCPFALAWLTEPKQRYVKYAPFATLFGFEGVHPQHPVLNREHVERWRKQGLYVGTWTVNDDDEIRRVATLGVDVIISDDPERARRLVS
jgi:glycerophosphoryl diester phosphodiesterase